MKRRILAIVLTVMMVLTMLPMNILAAEESDTHQHICPGAEVTHTKDNCTWEVVETVATVCGEDGYTVYKCHVCNAGFVADIVPAKAEHSYADVEGTAKDATCDAAGKKADQKCANCGKEVKGDEIPKLADNGEHTWEIVKVAEGKCDEERAAEQKCKVCGATGETTVPAGEHKWGKTPAINETSVVYTCDDCGATKTVDIKEPEEPEEPEAPHVHALTKVDAVAATCTENGNIEYYTCECGKLFADDKAATEIDKAATVVPAHAYTSVDTVVLEATCTEPGLKYTAKVCVECKTVYDNKEVVIDALGHDMSILLLNATEPLCDRAGNTAKYQCSRCDHTEGGEEIAAPGHNVVKVSVPASCGQYAYEFTYCANETCTIASNIAATMVDGIRYYTRILDGEVVTTGGSGVKLIELKVTGTTFDAENHGYNIKTTVKTKATCTTDGVQSVACNGCENFVPKTEAIPATGHTFNKGEDATLYERYLNDNNAYDGGCYYTYVKCANGCGAIEKVEEHNHAWGNKVSYAATCTSQSYDEYTCENCYVVCRTNYADFEYKADVVYETLDDAYVDHPSGWTNRTTARSGNCYVETLYLYTCRGCGETYFVEANNGTGEHRVYRVESEAVEPTCTEPGKTMYYYCNRCYEYIGGEEIPAKGHTEKVLKAVAPTCTETGLTEGKICTDPNCGMTLVAQEVVEALGHTEKVLEAVAATCEADGLTEGKVCTVCEETLIAQEVVEALGHNYEATVIAPKCEEKGFTLWTCANCGDSYIDTLVDALGHKMVVDEEASVAAKCEEAGKKVKVCANGCGKTEEKVLEALGHKNADEEVLENKCTNVVEGDRVCVNGCGKTIGQDHTDIKVTTVDATCAAEGYTLTECSACDLRKVVIAAKLECDAANEVVIPAVDATCAAEGATEGKKCSVCGDIKVAPEATEKLEKCLDTSWGDWAVETEPTEFVEGVEKRVCTVCGAEETRAIGVKTAINYTLDIDNAVVAGAGYADSSLVAVKVSLNTAKEFGVWGMKFDVNYDKADVKFVKYEVASANFTNVICNDNKGTVSILATAPNSIDKELVDVPVNGAEAVVVLYFRINNATAADTEFAVANAEVLNTAAQSMKSEGETETIAIAKFLDVNADTFVNLADALALYQLALNSKYDVTADVDKNGTVDLIDLANLYNYLVYINTYDAMVKFGQ